MASLLNLMLAENVKALLDDPMLNTYPPEQPRFWSRETALGIIHMALWGHSSREDSTAGAYAFMGLMDALGIKQWSFEPRPSNAIPADFGLHPDGSLIDPPITSNVLRSLINPEGR